MKRGAPKAGQTHRRHDPSESSQEEPNHALGKKNTEVD